MTRVEFEALDLPDSWDVGYAYSPRERSGTTGGYHLIVGEDFKAGRVQRIKGDALCGKRFYNLDPGSKKQGVSCKRCIELAGRVTAYPLTDEQRNAQVNKFKSEFEYEPNREELAIEARVEPEGRWGDE